MTKFLQEVFNKIEQLNPETQDAIASRLLTELENQENWQSFTPYITDEEQKEIEKEFGLPSDYEAEESIDMTDWVKNGGKIS